MNVDFAWKHAMIIFEDYSFHLFYIIYYRAWRIDGNLNGIISSIFMVLVYFDLQNFRP